MLGLDNYIVKSDKIGKLRKAVKDVTLNETEDKCNQKSEKVRQFITISFIMAGEKIFKASQLPFYLYTSLWNRRNSVVS